MPLRSLFRPTMVTMFCLLFSTFGLAQYGGGGGGTTASGGYTPPKGGYSSSTGIAIGAAAAGGVAIAYLALHKPSIVGCTEVAGSGLQLVNEKDKQTYALDSGSTDLKPGERVALKGKRIKSESGVMSFHVQGLAKDYGPCKQ